MNYIKINGEQFELPTNPEKVNSVLNHIEMCKEGLKQFVKLTPILGGEQKRISAAVLRVSKIYYNIDENF